MAAMTNPYHYRQPVDFIVDNDTTLYEAQEIARVLIEAQDITEAKPDAGKG